MSNARKAKFEWTRSETLALAQQSCAQCFGLGMRPSRNGAEAPCHCVFRAIFRACYERFRYCAGHSKYLSHVSLEPVKGGTPRGIWGLKHEEYCADFCLVSARTLTVVEHCLFRYYFLLAADWRICCQRLNIDRGAFFHEVYRIEQKLGRVFRELRPHALFPIDEYFQTVFTPDVKPEAVMCAAEDFEGEALTAVADFYPLRRKCEDDKTPRVAKAAA